MKKNTAKKPTKVMMRTGSIVVSIKKPKKKVMTASQAAKKAANGTDMGKKGKNFSKIADKAAAKYGSEQAGERVAGSIFQKMRKAGKL